MSLCYFMPRSKCGKSNIDGIWSDLPCTEIGCALDHFELSAFLASFSYHIPGTRMHSLFVHFSTSIAGQYIDYPLYEKNVPTFHFNKIASLYVVAKTYVASTNRDI